ncbi:MAG: hypothetical protein COW30_15350 [Rhodospirillales bacterium CG15_BIG_FIL_POST_REV_8_21_14_020_66_15]|nr:MAG: hypothetical protein COW30_15350 [Rhodospirillales bacterium CG15_BIG_FIL_POST_REV_8_21_14_020_66_15]
MATDFSAAVAAQINGSSALAVSRARSALAVERTSAATPSRATPDTLGLSLDPRRGITLRASQASTAVARAVAAGNRVVGQLRTLEAQLSTAINGGLVSPRTELRIDETRVSRLNITAAAGRTLDAIDRIVAAAETGGVNLISSAQGRVTIQTTEFGGRITVRAQPLDSSGLDLTGIGALTADEAREARARVRVALGVASARINSLSALGGTLEFRGGTVQAFARFGDEGLFEGAVRGRLVNLSA